MSNVLVVGAGPVGLTMALELARHGCHCRIVDRLAAATGFCKAIGVTPRTLEVWDDMGIAPHMIENGLWISGLRTFIAGRAAHDAPLDLSVLPYAQLGLPQYATEALLAEQLSRAGIEVERNMTLVGLSDRGDCIDVRLAHADGGTERATFRFVVGCDGAHSAVRHLTGIGFPGEGMGLDFMLGDVEIGWDVPRGFSVFSMTPKDDAPPDFLVAVPLPARNRYRISMLAPPELGGSDAGQAEEHGISAERPGPTLAELQMVADRLLPGPPILSSLYWSSRFRISMRLADKYRVGNAFIAGDAAHIHPPTGGQGMNTGIQDAYNLAWKMALVVRGEAGMGLLDSYEAERRPVGADVVAKTLAASRNFGRDRGKEDPLENTQVLISYRDSPAVADLAPADGLAVRAGDRAPDAIGLARQGFGFPLRLFDLLRGPEHVLIAWFDDTQAGPGMEKLEAVAASLKAEFGPLLRVVAIVGMGTGPSTQPAGAVLATDREGRFAQAYRPATGTALLVRPDGHVGLTLPALDAAGVAAHLRKVLVRDRP